MLTLINILIIFFLFLIIYQLFLANRVIEGLSSDQDDPLVLSKENEANINVLNKRVDKLDGVNEKITDLTNNNDNLQSQINDMTEQIQEIAENQPAMNPPSPDEDENNTT